MVQTNGLTHINLPVKNLEVSERFYSRLLGAKEVRRFDDCVMLRTPGTHEVITLTEDAQGAEALARVESFHFGFRLCEPHDMSKVLDEMSELGGRPERQGGSKEGGRLYAFGFDPNGYVVEIFWEND